MTAADPLALARDLLAKATTTERFDATRCALATAGVDGHASVRFVLAKQIDDEGFVFFTNYQSRKAAEIAATGWSAIAFHWESLGVQLRAEGPTTKIDPSESDAYFASRPRGSQLGAWASKQSELLDSRVALEAAVAEVDRRFAGRDVERPMHWGGYRLHPRAIEIWRNRDDRLHERSLYTRERGTWLHVQLQP
jgi:pyridoxamine 5'-phosphate oxidase